MGETSLEVNDYTLDVQTYLCTAIEPLRNESPLELVDSPLLLIQFN